MRDPWAIHDLMGRVSDYLDAEFNEGASAFHIYGWADHTPYSSYTGEHITVKETRQPANPFSEVIFNWEERADYVWEYFDRAMRRLKREYRWLLFLRRIGMSHDN